MVNDYSDLSLTISARMDVAMMWERRMFPTRNSSWYSQSRLQTTASRLNMIVYARCFGRASLENMSPVISDWMKTPKQDWSTSTKNEIRHAGWITRNLTTDARLCTTYCRILPHFRIQIQGGPKKVSHIIFAITLSTDIQFSYFLAHIHYRKFATGGCIVSPPNVVCVTTLPC